MNNYLLLNSEDSYDNDTGFLNFTNGFLFIFFKHFSSVTLTNKTNNLIYFKIIIHFIDKDDYKKIVQTTAKHNPLWYSLVV